ncbi:MAG: ergothioneine biosynthesis glutamate--cysteine ligase EgtA [Gemmatimonadota bacterium]
MRTSPPAGTRASGRPLSEDDAAEHAHGICFKTGPPGQLGVELEWLVRDCRDPALPVDHERVKAALAPLSDPGALPGEGRLTVEPGGQIELSSAPAAGVGACVAAACGDLTALRRAAGAAGLGLAGQGVDAYRPPRRLLQLPRYRAMEEFFDRSGPWGRIMMCSTASVQVCVDAGDDGDGPSGYRWRWQLLHALGPVLVAAFANSPMLGGRPSGWKSTRQVVWARLDPSRTRAPAGAEPPWANGHRRPQPADPRAGWAAYALDADVMCVRRPGPGSWTAPAGMTFRDWVRGAGDRPPTLDDLTYHLSTLFPPVRPQGHLELRVIDAQPGDDWIVPAAVVSALLDDPAAAQAAMAAAEPVWARPAGPGGRPGDGSPWLRAARHGPADPGLGLAARQCFEAADAALGREGAPAPVRHAVAAFADRYVSRCRCPADDELDQYHASAGQPPTSRTPVIPLEERS